MSYSELAVSMGPASSESVSPAFFCLSSIGCLWSSSSSIVRVLACVHVHPWRHLLLPVLQPVCTCYPRWRNLASLARQRELASWVFDVLPNSVPVGFALLYDVCSYFGDSGFSSTFLSKGWVWHQTICHKSFPFSAEGGHRMKLDVCLPQFLGCCILGFLLATCWGLYFRGTNTREENLGPSI